MESKKKLVRNILRSIPLAMVALQVAQGIKNALICNAYLPSTCFHSQNKPSMKLYKDFESLPHRRGYGIVILKDKARVSKALQSIDWEG